MVADAVKTKPVSAPLFPANREKNRGFRKKRDLGMGRDFEYGRRYRSSALISYSEEQGIILVEQGIPAREQGFIPIEIQIVAV
jgi:hypothetical protein